ncbi:hypothetical protein P4576_23720 [Peribacillus frigoritolerans]|uniref:hypothetical protein n=1 Tax=Peribacillus frigoritolerans TaxID=450367 RepID=UPI002E1C35EE|nr:hypothetical protein [Peribacillus frigoritolerans]
MGGISISLCMIVKDEEESLPTCLAAVRELVDEMIIIDTGSISVWYYMDMIMTYIIKGR